MEHHAYVFHTKKSYEALNNKTLQNIPLIICNQVQLKHKYQIIIII